MPVSHFHVDTLRPKADPNFPDLSKESDAKRFVCAIIRDDVVSCTPVDCNSCDWVQYLTGIISELLYGYKELARRTLSRPW
jgi:hypothetical protein